MNITMVVKVLLIGGGLGISALACGPANRTAEPVKVAESVVVAAYGDRTITLDEVDRTILSELEGLEKQRYNLREQALQGMVVQELIEREVRRTGFPSGKELVEDYLTRNVVAPTLKEVRVFFAENVKPTAPQATFKEFRERITGYLVEEANRKAMLNYFDQMQKEAGLRITLEAPARTRVVLSPGGASKGSEGAVVTIVEFADFECPYCSTIGSLLDEMVAAFPGQVRVVFKHFPLSFHQKAQKASEAAMCAQAQGHFWEYHDILFAHQDKLGVEHLKRYAEELKLDGKQFQTCLDSSQFEGVISDDLQAGQSAGVKGTPSIYVNGLLMEALDSESLKRAIELELTSLN